MKICYVADGRSVHTVRWLRWFASRGHEMHLITDSDCVIDGIETHQTSGRGGILSFFKRAREVKKKIESLEPDIVHGHYLFGYATFAAMSGHHPLVQSIWGGDYHVDWATHPLTRPIIKYTISKGDMFHSVSQHLTDWLMDRFKIHGDNIVTFPNFPDPEIFKPSKAMADDKIVIMTNRRLEPYYNPDQFFDALPQVLAGRDDIHVIVAGTGSQKERLEQKIRGLGLNEQVDFVGHVSHDTMANMLSNSDIFVSTSPTDGTSVSLLEAMSCGAFPVVTEIAATRPWIEDGKNGYLVPVGDVAGLAHHIIEAIESPELRKTAARSNRNFILSNRFEDHMMCMEEKMVALRSGG